MTHTEIDTQIPEPEIFPKKRVSISFHFGGSKHTLKFPPFVVGAFIFIIVLMLFFTVLLFAKGSPNASDLARLDALQKENTRMRGKLEFYSTQVDSILARIDSLKANTNKNDKSTSKDFPYVNPSLEARNANHSSGLALEARIREIDGKLATILGALGADVPVILSDPEPAIPGSGDGIPSIYPTFGRYADGWGLRIHPILNELRFHQGIDISNEIGTPIYATADGVVRKTDYEEGYGKRMFIVHEHGYETQYAHLYSFQVREGERVRKGQIIALMGNSGMSTGPHLHYEVILNGEKVDPLPYLNRIDTDQFAGK